jgi:cobalt-zinc-cadmium resistance protein CzcA
VVRLEGEKRQDLADVQNLLIPTPNGLQIPLSQLAKLKLLKVRIKYKEKTPNVELWLVLMFVAGCIKKLQGKVEARLNFLRATINLWRCF